MVKSNLLTLLNNLEEKLHQNIKVAMDMAVTTVVNEAKTNHRYKDVTSNLTNATKGDPVKFENGKYISGVSNSDEKAIWIHEGTKPYEIKPTGLPNQAGFIAKALEIEIAPGVKIYRKKVKHPGIKPDPFISKAIHTKRNDVLKIFSGALKNAIRQVAK